MTDLPIILEEDLGSWWLWTLPLCALYLVILWASLRAKLGSGITLSRIVVIVALLILPAAVLMLPVGWQFRFEQQGVVQRAPFDPLMRGGSLPWADLTAIDIEHFTTSTGSSYRLHFRGPHRADVVLPAIDRLPERFLPLFETVVGNRAPQARWMPDRDAFLRQFKHARQDRDPWWGFADYRILDGAGRELK